MKQARKLLALLLVLCSLAGVLPAPALAAEPYRAAAGQTKPASVCGEHLTWKLNEGTLTISGNGGMYDYSLEEAAPWYQQGSQGKIQKVVIEQGVTNVGSYAFYGCDRLSQVQLPKSVKTIGKWAFGGCTELKNVTIPATVVQIAEHAFGYYQGKSVLKLNGLTISGYTKSAASSYAQANGHISFKALDEKPVKLNAPEVRSVALNKDGVSVTWSQVSGAERYRVFYRNGSGKWISGGDTTGTSLVVTKLSSGKTYSFTVACLSSDASKLVSDYGKSVKSIAYIAAPVLTSVSNVNGGVQVTWDKVPGATKYRLFYRTETSDWRKVKDTTETSALAKNVVSGTKYIFTVRCVASDGRSYVSAYDKAGKAITYLSTPVLQSVTNVDGGIYVNWKKVNGAEKYRVFYRTAGSRWTKAGDTADTSFVIRGLSNGAKYTVTVRCVNPDGRGYISGYNSRGLTSVYLNAPELKSVSCQNGGVSVTWNKVKGIAKYRVFYRTATGDWSKAGETTGDSYTVTRLKSGTQYIFTVRGITSDGKKYTSGYDRKGLATVYIATPKLEDVEYLADGIRVNWDKVPGASQYRVFYRSASGKWMGIRNTNQNTLLITELDRTQRYTFTVRCVSADGKSYTSGYDAKGIQVGRISNSPAEYNFTSAYRSSGYYDKLMSVRLGGNARDNIVAVAMSQVGYQEGRYPSATGGNGKGYDLDNYTEYGRWYYNHVDSGDSYYKGAWCSMFVSWCANEAGISTRVIPRRALVEYMDNAFRAQGRYYTWNETQCGYGSKTIQKGDLIFYSKSSSGRLSHIGIVTDVTYKDGRAYISTVEGNADDKCRTRRWIMSKGSGGKIDGSHYIRGFACPAY